MVPAKRVAATIHGFKKSCDLLCAKGFTSYLIIGGKQALQSGSWGKIRASGKSATCFAQSGSQLF